MEAISTTQTCDLPSHEGEILLLLLEVAHVLWKETTNIQLPPWIIFFFFLIGYRYQPYQPTLIEPILLWRTKTWNQLAQIPRRRLDEFKKQNGTNYLPNEIQEDCS